MKYGWFMGLTDPTYTFEEISTNCGRPHGINVIYIKGKSECLNQFFSMDIQGFGETYLVFLLFVPIFINIQLDFLTRHEGPC